MNGWHVDWKCFLRWNRRRPGFALVVVGVLALGIGASVAVFGLVDALVLDPFPYPQPERLVAVGVEMPGIGRDLSFFEALSGPDIVGLTAGHQSFESILPFDLNSVRVRGPEVPERLFAAYVWADPFPVFGMDPVKGRGFDAAELAAGAEVAVISHELWRRWFGEDPRVLERSLVADGVSYRVIGVAPPHSAIYGADLYLLSQVRLADLPRDRRPFHLLARLAPGSGPAAASQELSLRAARMARELAGEHEAYRDWRVELIPWNALQAYPYTEAAWLTMGAVLAVLLLVCANLASLLLTRAVGERSEIAVRLALGAGRWSILRMAALESLGFALAGGLVGTLLAHWALRLGSAFLPVALQGSGRPVAVEGRVLLFAAGATLLVSLLFGLAPAWHRLRADLREALADSAHRNTAGRGARRAHGLFIGVQVALAVILVAAAVGLLGELEQVLARDLGFEPEGLLSMRISLPRARYGEQEVPRFFHQLVDQTRALPGVRSAAVATQVAPSTFFGAELHRRGEEEVPEGGRPRPFHTVVDEGYFATLGLPLLRGRLPGPEDSTCTLVVNQLAAERWFPAGAVGAEARLTGSRFDSGWCRIVGVVATVRNRGWSEAAAPEIFSVHRQAGGRFNQMFLLLRTAGDPETVVPAVRAAVQALDPDQPVYDIATGEQALAGQLATRRAAASLVSAFAATALALAVLGIYGVVAYDVRCRSGEMSLRMALGATSADLAGQVVVETSRIVAAGLVVGCAGTLALGHLAAALLPALATRDPGILLVPVGAVSLLALLASLLPAWKVAGRLQPAEFLHRR